jgi:hypothetical protein
MWYPWESPDVHSHADCWNAVNHISNCMAMDATTHIIHDSRLLAVHPVGVVFLILNVITYF